MAPGVAIADFDGDGHLDIFIVGQEESVDRKTSALFLSDGGDKYRDATVGSGLEQLGKYQGCATGDLDNDGKIDIFVTGYGTTRLYRNLGGGKFEDVTAASGLTARSADDWTTSVGIADVNGDGRLDLYVGRYVVFNDKVKQFCNYGDKQSACGPIIYDPQIGSLYLNQGGLKFIDVTDTWGLERAHGKCLGVAFGDVNGDGWPDLYLGNDEMPGDLFLNNAGKGFVAASPESGVALSGNGDVQGAMGVDFGDYDRDGKPDLIVTTFENESTALFRNLGNTIFESNGDATRIGEATRMFVGFGTKFADFNNDGWLDVAIVNGHIHDNQDIIDHFTAFRQPMQLLMNQEGKQFADETRNAGPGFTTPFVGRGLAVGDLNEDGKPDMVVTDFAGSVRVLINKLPNAGNWVSLSLQGSKSNKMAIGAKVTVVAGNEKWTAECTTGGSYMSASDPRVHFGLGSATKIDRIDIRWPSGQKSTVANPKINSVVQMVEP
jgi:hypothetical protein